jgi:hypothetical protein
MLPRSSQNQGCLLLSHAFDTPAFHRWLIELRDARSKRSSAGRHTDKEHGAAALRRWRRQASWSKSGSFSSQTFKVSTMTPG